MSKEHKPKRYNNYSLAIIGSLLAGVIVTLVMLLTAHGLLGDMPDWLYRLLCFSVAIVTVSGEISGGGYSFTGFDILTKGNITAVQLAQRAVSKSARKYKLLDIIDSRAMEFVGLVIGFLIAIALTAVLVAKKAVNIFATVFPVVGTIVFFLTNISAISGLCSRLGRCADYFRANNDSLRGANVNYVVSVLIGAVIGVILASVFIGVAGVTSVMTAGGAIPLWLGGAVAFITITSTVASASGYIGRWIDFLLGRRLLGMSKDSNDLGLKSRVNAERIGTGIGLTIGIALGATLIATGLALTPVMGMGLPLWAAGILVMAVSVSSLGGLGNRLGYVIDTLRGYRGDQEHAVDNGAKLNGDNLDHSPSKYHWNDEHTMGEGLLKLLREDKSATFTNSASAPLLVTGQGKKGNDDHEDHLDSGRRITDSGHVEPRVDTSEIPRIGSARCSFFGENNRETISGSDSAGLDVTGDVWYQLRQKVKNGEIKPAHTYNNDNSTCGRGEQISRAAVGRRLHHQAAVAA